MLYGQLSLKLSPYSDLYDILVPKDNILRKIKENVDFSFVNEMVADSYAELESEVPVCKINFRFSVYLARLNSCKLSYS